MADLWLNGGRAPRTIRSVAFLLVFAAYVSGVIGLGQRLVIWPLALARTLAGVRVSVDGAIPADGCIVVMNHQSLLDIPIGLSLVPGPYALIPTRDRYARGIPGISPLVRLAGFPVVSQRGALSRDELEALDAAAEQVARGERSLLIFPEGHRTRDGRIGRFMRSGLRIVLRRARRPVYCIVADGATSARTLADVLAGFANTEVRAVVLGPFAPPESTDEPTLDAFIAMLHARMTDALARLRGDAAPAPARAADPLPAR
jgi:1-acyl-sn-glycerol-3-phosphate acyltransferase